MERLPEDAAFRTLASAPSGQTLPVLPTESRLIELLRALGKPVEVMPDSGRFRQQLPDSEKELVRRARVELLVPIAMSPGHDEALLALGAKRSEEPYTREDRELLDTIAASLAPLFEQEALAAMRTTGSFGECPRCGTCSDSGSSNCALDGAALTPVPLRRTLAGRYHLERRRGRGGMGTIYEAIDNALGRRVAVKVIREEFVNSSAAARRFEREARAAGAFVHPNVVTVRAIQSIQSIRTAFTNACNRANLTGAKPHAVWHIFASRRGLRGRAIGSSRPWAVGRSGRCSGGMCISARTISGNPWNFAENSPADFTTPAREANGL